MKFDMSVDKYGVKLFPTSTSVASEEIQFWGVAKWPFLDKMYPGEVSNHKKIIDTHLRAQWELSNDTDDLDRKSVV